MTSDNRKKIKSVKQELCQKLFDGDTTIEELKQVEKQIIVENETENYYQAEAIKQAIDWYNQLN